MPSACIEMCFDSSRFATSRWKMTSPKDSRCYIHHAHTKGSDGSIRFEHISCRILLQKICYWKDIYRGPWVANLWSRASLTFFFRWTLWAWVWQTSVRMPMICRWARGFVRMRTFELFFFPELWTNKFGARMPALTLKKMYGKEFAIETQFAENKRGKRVEYLTSGAILLSQAARSFYSLYR